jgi:hypothetical protein
MRDGGAVGSERDAERREKAGSHAERGNQEKLRTRRQCKRNGTNWGTLIATD